ncbi:MAG TPA: CoA transferase [Bryobacteraceae bacterium]|nr:CoA transferase [Bryobacteraceae bacterium]
MIINQGSALEGIRVIDFGRFIAGPYCGMLLADMGADVIRIDRRGGSEDRFLGPVAEGGEGGMFLSLNRNKRSLTLDPGGPGSGEIIRRLAASADIVIANLPLDVMEKMGITYDALRVVKPDVILVMISAFGPEGPYAHRVGFDTVAQAMSGAMGLTGFPGAPTRSLVPFEDFGTALHAAFGAMTALYHRARTGEGQLVDASLLASGVTFMQAFLAERHVLDRERRQQGNAGFYSAPSDCYPVKDGWIVVAVIGGAMFKRWARLVGREDLLGDEGFRDDLSRGDHYPQIGEIMTEWTRQRTAAEAIAELEKARIPSGPAHSLEQTLCDPQVRARELLRYVPFPGARKDVPLANTPVRLSGTPGGIRHRAPLAGEHTEEVLGELGFSRDEIAEFRRLQVV